MIISSYMQGWYDSFVLASAMLIIWEYPVCSYGLIDQLNIEFQNLFNNISVQNKLK